MADKRDLDNEVLEEDISDDIIESYGEDADPFEEDVDSNDEPIEEESDDEPIMSEDDASVFESIMAEDSEEEKAVVDEEVIKAEKPKKEKKVKEKKVKVEKVREEKVKVEKIREEKPRRPLPEYDRNYDPDKKPEAGGHLDYLNITNDVFGQMFRASNLRRLQTPAGILWAIVMLPFFLASVALMVAYYVALFVFKMITNPADYLVSKLKEDAPTKWTTIVTFLIGYPAVFLYRAISAILSIQFFILHFFVSLNCYIYSFGGVTFHPFLFDAGYKRFEEEDEPFEVGPNVAAYVISILLIAIWVVIIVVSSVGGGGGGGNDYYPDDDNHGGYESYSEYDANEYQFSFNPLYIYGTDDIKLTNINSTPMTIYLQVSANNVNSITFEGDSSDYTVTYNYSTYTPDWNSKVNIDYVSYGSTITIQCASNYYGNMMLKIS